jgi:hypothetical protein
MPLTSEAGTTTRRPSTSPAPCLQCTTRHNETALLGPQLCAGLGNGILLGYLMWRSRLLPRPMVIFGLIGGSLALLTGVGVLLGAWGMHDGRAVALTAPEAIWEFSLTVWLLIFGFRPSPILTGRTVPTAA